ncbi:hypothetical protein B0H12DRAFT_207129 [Mycena haematopus]|nr:hypothetical protein B0H12DRAFT_207129 [Mycena haematopus]
MRWSTSHVSRTALSPFNLGCWIDFAATNFTHTRCTIAFDHTNTYVFDPACLHTFYLPDLFFSARTTPRSTRSSPGAGCRRADASTSWNSTHAHSRICRIYIHLDITSLDNAHVTPRSLERPDRCATLRRATLRRAAICSASCRDVSQPFISMEVNPHRLVLPHFNNQSIRRARTRSSHPLLIPASSI